MGTPPSEAPPHASPIPENNGQSSPGTDSTNTGPVHRRLPWHPGSGANVPRSWSRSSSLASASCRGGSFNDTEFVGPSVTFTPEHPRGSACCVPPRGWLQLLAGVPEPSSPEEEGAASPGFPSTPRFRLAAAAAAVAEAGLGGRSPTAVAEAGGGAPEVQEFQTWQAAAAAASLATSALMSPQASSSRSGRNSAARGSRHGLHSVASVPALPSCGRGAEPGLLSCDPLPCGEGGGCGRACHLQWWPAAQSPRGLGRRMSVGDSRDGRHRRPANVPRLRLDGLSSDKSPAKCPRWKWLLEDLQHEAEVLRAHMASVAGIGGCTDGRAAARLQL
uniref:Uncharacterized protein n=1 Tax=Pyrodinium bahamense TaxID=73915 RepID=A0A7S0BDM9_9DINO|mmetsp:Transcript_9877/g.27628  ORF Transcript_9877/g.27628 Transcript_9877/m.27628 type:complete len:332 (+) Transcript_9877:53-1048(+)